MTNAPAADDSVPAELTPAPAPAEQIGDGLPLDARDLAEIPAVEVITRAAVMLMSSAAEQLGLAAPGPDGAAARVDLDEARRLIEALAGLLRAAEPDLGLHRQPLRDGLRALQGAFREASPYPDDPGQGPGEKVR